ncbi:MAG: phosphoribosylamine--glycine ligase [Bryobacteraceae bacterium]
MKILVLGGGGREHALAWKLAQTPGTSLFACPGNPGIARIATLLPTRQSTPEEFLDLARTLKPDLTVVGPEAPLVAGVVDRFRREGLTIFGPTAAAARLEGSKVFAKQFFRDHQIPTARFRAVACRADALSALDDFGYPIVLKADGLAAGKGVIIASTRTEAEDAVATLGETLVIEEFLEGEELSFIAICDGHRALPLEPSQDHKRVFDLDQGPNTGGMGAYSDSRLLTPAQTQNILDRIMLPTVAALRFTGFLYAGLMMTGDGPKVLEFNVRMGDPETQPLLCRLRSNLNETLMDAALEQLGSEPLEWSPDPAVCVVMASGGYPGAYPTGKPITGIEDAEATGATVFHAGTRHSGSGVETAGGRVLGVTASAATLDEAIRNAYFAVSKIHFGGAHYRKDIGRRGLTRYNKEA